ncbi:MAG: response regulator, partial [bacterium]
VDDSRSMRRIVMKGLQKAQVAEWDFDEAEDGEDALAKFDPEIYDMLFIDWNMPKMTGLELVKMIRSDSELKHLPILMVTAEALQENIVAAAKAGVNNYIVKPFDAKTLSEKMSKIFP